MIEANINLPANSPQTLAGAVTAAGCPVREIEPGTAAESKPLDREAEAQALLRALGGRQLFDMPTPELRRQFEVGRSKRGSQRARLM